MRAFRLTADPIDTRTARENLQSADCGGYASFEGWVRDHNEGKTVAALDYEAYAPLANKEGDRILTEAKKKFEIHDAACEHRIGALTLGELAVWVGASAPHRDAAFAACRYIIDEIKARVPIWKKEHYADGSAEWVNCAACADHVAAKSPKLDDRHSKPPVHQSKTDRPDKPIYLDYQATTPMDPRVLDAMMPYLTEEFGNPHSSQHAYGWRAAEAVHEARAQVAELIGAQPRDMVFTSGATEANNLAIFGVADSGPPDKRHVITCVTEHPSVLEPVHALEARGFRVTELPVQANGLIDLKDLDRALTDDTLLVTIMAVNNEIGVIQPLQEIGALSRERGAIFHTDAAQGAGKIPLDVDALRVDLMSITAHKMYGPMGIGALFIRQGIGVSKRMFGGGQEHGLRAGTLPAPLCVGIGAACEIAGRELQAEARRLASLRERLLAGLNVCCPELQLNGDMNQRIPGNLNLRIPGIAAEALMSEMPGVAVSTASACASADAHPSHVLAALGLSPAAAAESLRVGIGRFTDQEKIDAVVTAIETAVPILQRESRKMALGNH